MSNNRWIVLIPGYGEQCTDNGYRELIARLKSVGVKTFSIKIKWERTTIVGWVKQTRNQLKKLGNREYDVVGFSFGAFIATQLTDLVNISKLYFCSLSPYFKDDIATLPALAWKILGKRRMGAFKKIEFAPKRQPADFFVGDKDMSFVINRAKKSSRKWKNSRLILMKDVPHDFANQTYVTSVFKTIRAARKM